MASHHADQSPQASSRNPGSKKEIGKTMKTKLYGLGRKLNKKFHMKDRNSHEERSEDGPAHKREEGHEGEHEGEHEGAHEGAHEGDYQERSEHMHVEESEEVEEEKPSQFLALASEIRFAIYGYLVPHVAATVESQLLEPASDGDERNNFTCGLFDNMECIRSLFHTCRTINQEIATHLFKGSAVPPIHINIGKDTFSLRGLTSNEFTGQCCVSLQSPHSVNPCVDRRCTGSHIAGANPRRRATAHELSESMRTGSALTVAQRMYRILPKLPRIFINIEYTREDTNESPAWSHTNDEHLYCRQETLKCALKMLNLPFQEISFTVSINHMDCVPSTLGTIATVQYLLSTFLDLGRIAKFQLEEVVDHVVITYGDGDIVLEERDWVTKHQYLWRDGRANEARVEEEESSQQGTDNLVEFAENIKALQSVLITDRKALAVESYASADCYKIRSLSAKLWNRTNPKLCIEDCRDRTKKMFLGIQSNAHRYSQVGAHHELSQLLSWLETKEEKFTGEHDCNSQTLTQFEKPPVSLFFKEWVNNAEYELDSNGYVLIPNAEGLTYALPRTADSIELFQKHEWMNADKYYKPKWVQADLEVAAEVPGVQPVIEPSLE